MAGRRVEALETDDKRHEAWNLWGEREVKDLDTATRVDHGFRIELQVLVEGPCSHSIFMEWPWLGS